MLQSHRNQVKLTSDVVLLHYGIVLCFKLSSQKDICDGTLYLGSILVMDVEGTDGREKEDQKAFEGKSALFSLALTDIMMVNMWMHEVGRFNAANLPLLKTVFEVYPCPCR